MHMSKRMQLGMSFLIYFVVFVLAGFLINAEKGLIRLVTSGLISDVLFHVLSHYVRRRLERKKKD